MNGIITLHSDDTSNGLYGFVSGAVLSEHLSNRRCSQRRSSCRGTITGSLMALMQRGIITEGWGVLQALPGLASPPFEITFKTPQKSPLHLQVEAFNAALQTILIEYRYPMAIAQNI